MTAPLRPACLAFALTWTSACTLRGDSGDDGPVKDAPTGSTPEADDAPEGDTDDASGPLTLTSPAFVDGGVLPIAHTCDGDGTSPPLAWQGVPDGTNQLALLMTTLARDGVKWNWVVWQIPADTTSLETGVQGVGVSGLTSDGPKLAYAPPCSQGPGAKSYTFTLYALSAAPSLPADPHDVTGDVLTAAIADDTLAQASATVSYTRVAP